MESPTTPTAELGGTSAVPTQLISDSFGGTEDTLGGTDSESVDKAPYRSISKLYHRGCPRKYFLYIGKSFHDSSVDVTFHVVKLTYNPDFEEKSFTSTMILLNTRIPLPMIPYTSTPLLWDFYQTQILFYPCFTAPFHSVCPGPSVPAPIILVTVGYVNPNTKSTHFFHGPSRSRITRAQYFQRNKNLKFDQYDQEISNQLRWSSHSSKSSNIPNVMNFLLNGWT